MKTLIITIYILAFLNIIYNIYAPTNNISKIGAVIGLIGITGTALNNLDD